MASYPALFLDRDGVINEERGYVCRPEDFLFLAGVFDACRKAIHLGYKLVVITNQAGIARGYYLESDFESLTDWMLAKFREQAVDIDGVYYCPHHPVAGKSQYRVNCNCRKPRPGMLQKAARELCLDLESSVLVGDKISDIEAGMRAGLARCILVRSGHPIDGADIPKGVVTADDLMGAVRLLESAAGWRPELG